MKYSGAGTAVTATVYRQRADAGIAVADDGFGIVAADQLRVFEPFYWAARASVPGSGLGRAIIAAIARRLGGHAVCCPVNQDQGRASSNGS